MDKRPPLDPSLLAPIFVGVCSLLGILLVLLGMRFSAARGGIPTAITSTPPRFQYLATEPGVAALSEAPTAEELPAATEEPTEFPELTEVLTFPVTLPPARTVTPLLLATNTPSAGTITATLPSLDITYDDADPKLSYTGNWISQSGVNNTYHSTLHISSTIGDAVQFIFFGQKMQLAYQAGAGLGTITIRLDSTDFVLDQVSTATQSGVWESPVFTLANHTVTITHISGGSVNLDSLSVIDLSTPVPTATPTP
jgi:hypothetical protein